LRLAYAAAAALALQLPGPTQGDPLLTYPLKIKGHTIKVEIANDEATRQSGLMFRDSMADNHGMLFVYERPGRHAMWMKNTLIPLAVAFMANDGRIINIEEMLPQTEDTHAAQGAAAYALEMNGGWFNKRGIKKGDRVLGLEKLPRSK